ncbi:MAG TPA: class I SAM-dependent methyltransferase [Solirubrobacteraceae bacterium]|nr:class I SAM-dependent methyltransferase [Solirubrobacteraceae bacterium]
MALGRVLEHTVFQLRRVDEHGVIYRPRGRAQLSIAVNQALAERGVRAPWAWSAGRCQEFWATLGHDDRFNAPADYAIKRTEIVDFMHELWTPEVSPGDSVLEVGSNAGANLERLRTLGYRDLRGIEINPTAIAELRRAFPQLAETATIQQGAVEQVLRAIPSGAVDVVFAMAVLHHIHPHSHGVFAEMVRIAHRHVCVIEPEQEVSHYIFARNYRRVFERLGCRQLRAVEISPLSFPGITDVYRGSYDYHGYTARLFSVPT